VIPIFVLVVYAICQHVLYPVESWAVFSRRQFFLNFDVAILCNRAQHLLALARKVEQGGLNG